MIQSIKMAWTFNPEERPTAKEIVQVLRKAMESVGALKDNDGLYRITTLPLLPNNYKQNLNMGGY